MWNRLRRWREMRAQVDGEAERMIAEMGALPAILAAYGRFSDTSRPLSERASTTT